MTGLGDVVEKTLAVSGMSCANCARHVETALSEDELVELVSRDSMVGVAQAKSPAQVSYHQLRWVKVRQ